MASSLRLLLASALGLVAALGACVGAPPATPPSTGLPDASAALDEPDASSPDAETEDAAVAVVEPVTPEPAKKDDTCPSDMIYVDGSFCPHDKLERRCLKSEYNKPNHLHLCHEFAPKTVCKGTEEPRRFCIDRFEYPNVEGAHPPSMVSWYDGQATCESKGKRLCYESEWVTACEGPDKTPFPYGWKRDNTACNIDNEYISPPLKLIYNHNPAISGPALARIDQSVPSGAMSRCKSGYGVQDMTGNFDEWVTSDQPPEAKSKWAGLKGGAWGHVRNACRPMTTSHPPDFTYYFISFRCCADAKGQPVYHPTKSEPAPEVKPADRVPPQSSATPIGPSKHKVAPANFEPILRRPTRRPRRERATETSPVHRS